MKNLDVSDPLARMIRRKRLGKTQEQIAELAGIGRCYVNFYENHRRLSPRMTAAIEQTLNNLESSQHPSAA